MAGFAIVLTIAYLVILAVSALSTIGIKLAGDKINQNYDKYRKMQTPITVEAKIIEENGFNIMERSGDGYKKIGFEEDYYMAYYRLRRMREKDPKFRGKLQVVGNPERPIAKF